MNFDRLIVVDDGANQNLSMIERPKLDYLLLFAKFNSRYLVFPEVKSCIQSFSGQQVPRMNRIHWKSYTIRRFLRERGKLIVVLGETIHIV